MLEDDETIEMLKHNLIKDLFEDYEENWKIYLLEEDLRGNRTYFHGSLNTDPNKLINKNLLFKEMPFSKRYSKEHVFYFSHNIGLAFKYIIGGDLPFIHDLKKFENEIEIPENNIISKTKDGPKGTIYPMSLKPNTNIFSILREREMSEFRAFLMDNYPEMHLRFEDRKSYDKMKQMDLFYHNKDLIVKIIREMGYDGFFSYEESVIDNDNYYLNEKQRKLRPAIGIFRDKMNNLNIGKPILVVKDGDKLKMVNNASV